MNAITYPPELLPRAEPDDDAQVIAQCDCCGKTAPLSFCIAYGIDTYACDECRGWKE